MKRRLYVGLLAVLLGACAPQAQTTHSQSEELVMLEPQPLSPLLGSTVTVPLTDSRIPVDDALIRGEGVAFSGGTLRLLPSQRLDLAQGDRQFLLIPLHLSRVTENSLHLLLLERTEQRFTQRDDVNLGKDVDLVSLRLKAGKIEAATLGTKTGLPSAEAKGSVAVFRLLDGKLMLTSY